MKSNTNKITLLIKLLALLQISFTLSLQTIMDLNNNSYKNSVIVDATTAHLKLFQNINQPQRNLNMNYLGGQGTNNFQQTPSMSTTSLQNNGASNMGNYYDIKPTSAPLGSNPVYSSWYSMKTKADTSGVESLSNIKFIDSLSASNNNRLTQNANPNTNTNQSYNNNSNIPLESFKNSYSVGKSSFNSNYGINYNQLNSSNTQNLKTPAITSDLNNLKTVAKNYNEKPNVVNSTNSLKENNNTNTSAKVEEKGRKENNTKNNNVEKQNESKTNPIENKINKENMENTENKENKITKNLRSKAKDIGENEGENTANLQQNQPSGNQDKKKPSKEEMIEGAKKEYEYLKKELFKDGNYDINELKKTARPFDEVLKEFKTARFLMSYDFLIKNNINPEDLRK